MSPLRRYTAIILVGLSITALILLSSGISNLRFNPGTLFQDNLIEELRELLWASRGLLDFMLILFIILPVIVAMLFLLQPARSKFTGQRKRSIISSVIQLVLIISAILLLRRRVDWQDFQLIFSKGIPQNITEFDFVPSESVIYSLPWWLNFILSFLLIGAALLFLARALSTSRKKENPAFLISKEAELAVLELNRGKSFNNVILDCYFEMNRILREQQGISRAEAITPREFEDYLISLGFPAKPVSWLTRLFERARYGNQDVDVGDQNLAIECLEEIRGLGED